MVVMVFLTDPPELGGLVWSQIRYLAPVRLVASARYDVDGPLWSLSTVVPVNRLGEVERQVGSLVKVILQCRS